MELFTGSPPFGHKKAPRERGATHSWMFLTLVQVGASPPGEGPDIKSDSSSKDEPRFFVLNTGANGQAALSPGKRKIQDTGNDPE